MAEGQTFDVVRGLRFGLVVEPERRRRFWLEFGDSFSLCGLVLIPIRTNGRCEDERYFLNAYGADGAEIDVRRLCALSLEPTQPYRIVPRALAYRPVFRSDTFDPAVHRAHRILFEIQHTGTGRPCWAHWHMEGHHAQPNRPATGV